MEVSVCDIITLLNREFTVMTQVSSESYLNDEIQQKIEKSIKMYIAPILGTGEIKQGSRDA